jgi:hypothetical protein
MIVGCLIQDFKALIFKFHKDSNATAIASNLNKAELKDSHNAPFAAVAQQSIGMVIKLDPRHSIVPRLNTAMRKTVKP